MGKSGAAGTETESKMSVGIAIRSALVFIVLCGIIYPLVSTGVAQVIMPGNANGSMIANAKGETVGSELIGQKFNDPNYFHGRVSSIDYKAEASGTNNYAPSNPDMLKRTEESIAEWKKNNPDVPVSELPIDLITNSGSGLDPHISPASAMAQVPRVSKQNGVSEEQLIKLVDDHTEGRSLGVFGEPRVNVLKLNLALERLLSK